MLLSAPTLTAPSGIIVASKSKLTTKANNFFIISTPFNR